MENELIDLSDLSDIPKKLSNELSISKDKGKGNFKKELIDIFKKFNKGLRIDEVAVAYYRLYGKVKPRKSFMVKLYAISRSEKPAIETVKGKRGVYRLKKT